MRNCILVDGYQRGPGEVLAPIYVDTILIVGVKTVEAAGAQETVLVAQFGKLFVVVQQVGVDIIPGEGAAVIRVGIAGQAGFVAVIECRRAR